MVSLYEKLFGSITSVLNQSFYIVGYNITLGNILAFIIIGSIFITFLKFIAS